MSQANLPITLVLADDHPVVLRGLQSLIASSPLFEVVGAAADGAEALELVRQIRPLIALFDMQMPKMTGLEVLRELQHDELHTKVVFLTATAEDAQVTQAVKAGAWGIMVKDAAADDLLACLEAVSKGSRWLPPDLIDPAFERETSRQEEAERYDGVLTDREREIAALVARGLANKEISRKINISEGTVKIHLHNIYQKIGVANRTALATIAQRYWSEGDSQG